MRDDAGNAFVRLVLRLAGRRRYAQGCLRKLVILVGKQKIRDINFPNPSDFLLVVLLKR